MKIQIEKAGNNNHYTVSVIVKSGKIAKHTTIGKIYAVDNYFVLMSENKPEHVLTNISDMDNIMLKRFKVRPTYVNILF